MPAKNKEIDNGIDLDEIIAASRPRALIIDDEPDTVMLLKEIFKRAGFDVSGALNSTEAFNRLSSVNPSLILLDLMMPGMDGWETIQVLRHITNSPIIIISAIGQTESVVKALKMGADDYIAKPFYAEEVIARARNVMRRSGEQKPMERLAFPAVDLGAGYENAGSFLSWRTHPAHRKDVHGAAYPRPQRPPPGALR